MAETRLPAVSIVGIPGRWKTTLELSCEIERRGFTGIYVPSLCDALGFCQELAHLTERIRFGTAIVNIYTRHSYDYARSAALIHELSGGRFEFGIGVSHDPMNSYLGVTTGKPVSDMRDFVSGLRSARKVGELPPVVLAALRDPMVKLAGDCAEGVVFANAALSRMDHSLGVLPDDKRSEPSYFIGNMIPTCISDDESAAAARNRKTMVSYMRLPNYREYWKTAGYAEEMEAAGAAIDAGDDEALLAAMTDRWLDDCTLFGSASKIRERVEGWFDCGVRTPILVPSSATGNQMKAFDELIAIYD